MVCYECFMRGQRRDAIGLCHHCSVAVCAEHAEVVAVPITEKVLLVKEIVLPQQARRLFCKICRAAIEQDHVVAQDEGQTVSSREAEPIDVATVSSECEPVLSGCPASAGNGESVPPVR